MTSFSEQLPLTAIDRETLFRQLAAGISLVTGNNRLTRVLAAQYSRWRVELGDRQWPTPRLFSWEAWLDRLWEAAAIDGVPGTRGCVLGRRQLLGLWERILRDDPESITLLRPESLAPQLVDTRRLLVDWRIDSDVPAWGESDGENCAAFRRWNRAYLGICRKNRWLAPEDRSAVLAGAILEGRPVPEEAIGLLGFDEFNPAQRQLLDAIESSGRPVAQYVFYAESSDAILWKSSDARDELRQMARWARYWYEKEPETSIGIVVPDLQSRRPEIERVLHEVLLPGEDVSAPGGKPWNLSLGVPLASVTMVESAFDLLSLLDQRVDIQLAGRVLRSRWFEGGESERYSRALLEKRLRACYPRQLKPGEIRYRAGEVRTHDRNREPLPPEEQEPRAWASPIMSRLLTELIRFKAKRLQPQRPSEWAEAFDRLLGRLGWPQNDGAGPEERAYDWQARQAWQEALSELASLDLMVSGLSRAEAVGQLRQICNEHVFQAKSPPASIQVLGLYEASGLKFDHLWVLGMHNDNWPPTARPNPFIPGRLQQQSGLPHASPGRELEVARRITQRLLDMAGDCVFSYPGQMEGEEVLPSPLFRGERFQSSDKIPAWSGDRWHDAVNAAPGPCTVPLEMPLPLQGDPARGGSSILKNQALCPFRAFASNRLGADTLETPADGISPMLHGSLLHRVLEGFWRETQSQEALLRLEEEELIDRINSHVGRVLDEERAMRDRTEFRDVEGARLARLVASHLELEKLREPFEVVGFEQEVLAELGGLAIRLYVDRMDRHASGETVIIDYKSGKVDPKKWFGDRPEDPQLPLYGISAAEPPAAIAFAVIRDDECIYRGVVSAEGLLPGLPPRPGKSTEELIRAGQDIPVTLHNWRQTLHRLMADFLSGNAAVDPKTGSRTCTDSYCELQPLCRVEEMRQLTPGGSS